MCQYFALGVYFETRAHGQTSKENHVYWRRTIRGHWLFSFVHKATVAYSWGHRRLRSLWGKKKRFWVDFLFNFLWVMDLASSCEACMLHVTFLAVIGGESGDWTGLERIYTFFSRVWSCLKRLTIYILTDWARLAMPFSELFVEVLPGIHLDLYILYCNSETRKSVFFMHCLF